MRSQYSVCILFKEGFALKYAIVKCTDTNFAVHGEYPTLQAAKVAFHQYSANLWNDAGTTKAC